MELTVTNGNWNLFFVRFFFALIVATVCIGMMAYIWLPKNPGMYVIFVTFGAIGSILAMKATW